MTYFTAFWVGGTICMLTQLLIDRTSLTPAKILTGLVVLGVILGALGLYPPFQDFAGAGASVPLLGFGNTLAQGVKEAVDREGFPGIFTGPLSACSAGITAAIVCGLIAAVFFRPRDKS